MSWKISTTFNLEILGVFVKILSSDDKYPGGDCENLEFPIQMQLSYKQKNFCWIFCSVYGTAMKF